MFTFLFSSFLRLNTSLLSFMQTNQVLMFVECVIKVSLCNGIEREYNKDGY